MIIKIGSLEYEVFEVADLVANDGRGLYGEIDYSNQTIKIEKKQTRRRQLLVLWHEVFHGICELYGFDFNESTVATLAEVVFTTIESNPIFHELEAVLPEERAQK